MIESVRLMQMAVQNPFARQVLRQNEQKGFEMSQAERKAELDDIAVWPDGEWCLWLDIESYGFKSDDYRIVPVNSEEWKRLIFSSAF